jgi:hypothetical protein
MTIAIVVETGAGTDPTANSYCSVADLQAYAALRGSALPAAADDCAMLLIRAMDYIEAQRDRFKGVKSSQVPNLQAMPGYIVGYPEYVSTNPDTIPAESAQDQPLQWPRTGVSIDYAILPSNVIPRELQYGQMAQALLVYDQQQNPANYVVSGPVIEQTNEVSGAVKQTTRWASPSTNPGRVLPVNAFANPDTLLNVLYKRGALSIAASRS